MKTLEFKIKLTQEEEKRLLRWLAELEFVWDRALGMLEWAQYYRYVEMCEAVPSEEIVHRHSLIKYYNNAKNKKASKEDFGLCCYMTLDMRVDRSKGWEVQGNRQVVYVVQLAPLYWREKPTFDTGLSLKKAFSRKVWQNPDITVPQVYINELIDTNLLPAWREYQKGKRGRPRYWIHARQYNPTIGVVERSFGKRMKTIESRVSGTYGQYEGDKIKLPQMVLTVKGLEKRLNGAKVCSFQITQKASGWYLQLTIDSPQKTYSVTEGAQPLNVKIGHDPALLYETEQWQVRTQGITPKEEKRKIFYQRKMSKCQVGSVRWHKYRRLIAKIDEKVSRRRRQWQQHQSTILTRIAAHRGIELEVITREAPVQKPDPIIAPDGTHYLPNGAQKAAEKNKSQLSAAWGQFKVLINDKANRSGIPLTQKASQIREPASSLPRSPLHQELTPPTDPPQQKPLIRRKPRKRLLESPDKFLEQVIAPDTNRALNKKLKELQDKIQFN